MGISIPFLYNPKWKLGQKRFEKKKKKRFSNKLQDGFIGRSKRRLDQRENYQIRGGNLRFDLAFLDGVGDGDDGSMTARRRRRWRPGFEDFASRRKEGGGEEGGFERRVGEFFSSGSSRERKELDDSWRGRHFLSCTERKDASFSLFLLFFERERMEEDDI